MRSAVVWLLIVLVASPAAAVSATWEEVQAEPDLERKSRLAVEFARQSVDPAMEAFLDGNVEAGRAWLERITDAVELAQASLEETGKHARKKPKHFKRAEIETRKLVNDLRTGQRKLSFAVRPELDPVIERIEEINRELLFAIMRKK